MSKNKSDMFKSIIVLTVISLISGLLLSMAYQFTRISPAEEAQMINAKLNKIYMAQNGYESITYDKNENKNIDGFYKVKDEEYYIIISNGKGYKGKVQMFVSFTESNIVKVTAGTNSDTPGIKDKATNEEYLKQFYTDINNKVFTLTKNGGDFDAAAGATYTSTGVISAINNAVTLYKNYLGILINEQAVIAKLNTIHTAPNGYEKIEYVINDNLEGFYKAKNEDYFIIISNGNGYNGAVQMYVSFSGSNIVKVTAGTNSETRSKTALTEEYLSRYLTNINNSVFSLTNDGGDFDAAAGATYTSRGVAAAVNNAVTLYKTYLGGL